jgi:hypothetical protein
MKKLFILTCMLLIVFASCKDKVGFNQPAFVGYWYGTSDGVKYSLKITADSHAIYIVTSPGSDPVTIEGTARANTTRMNLSSRQYFDIVAYPHAIDTTVERFYIPINDTLFALAMYKMTLNGLHKASKDIPSGEWVYYK